LKWPKYFSLFHSLITYQLHLRGTHKQEQILLT
jgi:hypothetical protein